MTLASVPIRAAPQVTLETSTNWYSFVYLMRIFSCGEMFHEDEQAALFGSCVIYVHRMIGQ